MTEKFIGAPVGAKNLSHIPQVSMGSVLTFLTPP